MSIQSQDDRMERLMSQLQLSQLVSQSVEPSDEHLITISKLWTEQNKLMLGDSEPVSMQEVIIDLEVLQKTGVTLSQFLKRAKANTDAFTLREFGHKLAEKFVHNGEFDWLTASEVAAPIINRAPGLPLMLGTFKPNAPFVMPERKRRAPSGKDEVCAKQKPDNVKMVEKNTNSIDAKVNFMVKVMKKVYQRNGNKPIFFYDFILHPTNFTTTVENVFYFSFVIRDGLAAIEVIDDELYISPMERGESNSQIIKKQMIFSITMQKWQTIIKERGITRAAIDWPN